MARAHSKSEVLCSCDKSATMSSGFHDTLILFFGQKVEGILGHFVSATMAVTHFFYFTANVIFAIMDEGVISIIFSKQMVIEIKKLLKFQCVDCKICENY